MKYLMVLLMAGPSFAFAMTSSPKPNERVNSHSELKRLLLAKTVVELAEQVSSADQVAIKREECKAELALNVIPRSCFTLRRLESQAVESWLTLECEKRARKSTSRLDLALDPENSAEEVPASCRRAIEVRMADLDYLNPMAGQESTN